MPEEREERREIIVTNGNGRNPMVTILAAIIIAGAVIFAIWFFAFQTGTGEEEAPDVTIEIDPGLEDDQDDQVDDQNDEDDPAGDQ